MERENDGGSSIASGGAFADFFLLAALGLVRGSVDAHRGRHDRTLYKICGDLDAGGALIVGSASCRVGYLCVSLRSSKYGEIVGNSRHGSGRGACDRLERRDGSGRMGRLPSRYRCALFCREQIPRTFVLRSFPGVIAVLFRGTSVFVLGGAGVQKSCHHRMAPRIFCRVFRSATTDRGEEFFREARNFFYYIQVIVRNLWPWWWAVPASLFLALRGKYEEFRDRALLRWMLVAVSFFSAFIVPLSLVSYKLPHYLHPTYLPLAPLAGYFLAAFSKRFFPERLNWMLHPSLRWVLLVATCVVVWAPGERVSSSENRGQDFIAVRASITEAPARCALRVPRGSMDAFRMEAYALWYFEGREWSFSEQRYPSQIALPLRTIYWDPQEKRLWATGDRKK